LERTERYQNIVTQKPREIASSQNLWLLCCSLTYKQVFERYKIKHQEKQPYRKRKIIGDNGKIKTI